MCIISEQAGFMLLGADGLHPSGALGKGTTMLTHGSNHEGGQAEDLWTLEDFSRF